KSGYSATLTTLSLAACMPSPHGRHIMERPSSQTHSTTPDSNTHKHTHTHTHTQTQTHTNIHTQTHRQTQTDRLTQVSPVYSLDSPDQYKGAPDQKSV